MSRIVMLAIRSPLVIDCILINDCIKGKPSGLNQVVTGIVRIVTICLNYILWPDTRVVLAPQVPGHESKWPMVLKAKSDAMTSIGIVAAGAWTLFLIRRRRSLA
jgi:hypothetical protein